MAASDLILLNNQLDSEETELGNNLVRLSRVQTNLIDEFDWLREVKKYSYLPFEFNSTLLSFPEFSLALYPNKYNKVIVNEKAACM